MLLCSISRCTLDLVVVVVQTGDMSTSKLCDFASRSSDTTADIEDFVAILNTDLRSEVMFMSCNGLVEALAICETAEMERLSPTVLVEICSEVVVARR